MDGLKPMLFLDCLGIVPGGLQLHLVFAQSVQYGEAIFGQLLGVQGGRIGAPVRAQVLELEMKRCI